MRRRDKFGGDFGWCPYCCDNDGYFNVGPQHWFVCDKDRTKWHIGANLFSSWRDQTYEEQRHAFYLHGRDTYEVVEPVVPSHLAQEFRTAKRRLMIAFCRRFGFEDHPPF
jgi:hypothetical protein